MFKPAFDKLISLIFPERPPCPVCGIPGSRPGICRGCFEELCLFKKSPTCPKCGRFPLHPIPPGGSNLCSECREDPPLFDLARAVGPYEDLLKENIYQFKYFGRRSLAEPLAALMTELFLAEKRWQQADAFVPVPIGPEKLLTRRFNQAELLAVEMGRVLRMPVINLLERRFDTVTQSKLTKQERRLNLRQAFKLTSPRDAVGKRLVLIDDILTTGTTADECTATLKAGGAAEVFVLTLATGRR